MKYVQICYLGMCVFHHTGDDINVRVVHHLYDGAYARVIHHTGDDMIVRVFHHVYDEAYARVIHQKRTLVYTWQDSQICSVCHCQDLAHFLN